MDKTLSLIKSIRQDLEKDWSEELDDYDLRTTFIPIINTSLTLADKNRIICYIVYAFNPDSLWLDLKKDRIENKKRILSNLDADLKKEVFKKIISNKFEPVSESIFNYLDSLTDWRWKIVFDLIEHSENIRRFAMSETKEEKEFEEVTKDGQVKTIKEDIDIKTIAAINKDKTALLEQSIETRKKAEEMLEKIRKDFVATDNATQADLGFNFSETPKKRNILSWREYIKSRPQPVI